MLEILSFLIYEINIHDSMVIFYSSISFWPLRIFLLQIYALSIFYKNISQKYMHGEKF